MKIRRHDFQQLPKIWDNIIMSTCYYKYIYKPNVQVDSSVSTVPNNSPWNQTNRYINHRISDEHKFPEVNETVLTLKKSCPLSAHLILLGLISQAISLPLVPFGTLTSMKTSSIVCAHEPHGVLDGTTPLLSSKWSAILNYWGIPLSGKYYRLVK